MSKRRLVATVTFFGIAFTASACTAILSPKDEPIVRCNNVDDCPKLDDNRHVYECIYAEGQSESSDKICVADFRTNVSCNPMSYAGDHPLVETFDDATDNASKALYGSCSTLGLAGCPPDPGTLCADGLMLDDTLGLCIDPNETQPTIYPPDHGGVELAGKDVLDQFCRWRFCEEDWVCDTDGFTCKPCDPGAPFEEGGCGNIYLDGQKSTVYTDLADANCDGSKADPELTDFGPVQELVP
ncbi:MAG: hypothetical protein HC927_10620 [Deltaproteobacteria bacterium]|nr:hypothetical protein [Deltaproteobacteria bacterium]